MCGRGFCEADEDDETRDSEGKGRGMIEKVKGTEMGNSSRNVIKSVSYKRVQEMKERAATNAKERSIQVDLR